MQIPTTVAAGDSRPIHYRMFTRLTPAQCQYYAGHFRGEDFRCLKFHEVGVPGDPRVGSPAIQVTGLMKELLLRLQAGLVKIDSLNSRADQLPSAVRLACHFLELILRIHPYVNGNGHMARFAVWALLGRYGYWPNPNRWPIEPRPAEPYTLYIIEFRNGNKAPLEYFMLDMLIQGGA